MILPACQETAPEELEFSVMQDAYRRTGGLACCDDVVQQLAGRWDQPISLMARWIVAREVVSFNWRSQMLLPLFQFDAADMRPRPAIAAVTRELADVFDNWELAVWFVQPNCMLRCAMPVDAIERDPAAVLSVARAQRYALRA